MMEPHEEPLVEVDIEPITCDIESKPSYVEFSSECGDITDDFVKKPAVAEVEGEEMGRALSSARPSSKIWKFIVPLTLIAAVSGTIATVSRHEANVKETKSVDQNQPLKPTTVADNLMYVAPDTTKQSRANSNLNASKVSKDGSRTKGSKASTAEGGTEGLSFSMNMMLDIESNALETAEEQPQFIFTAKAEKGSKGSKTVGENSGGETTVGAGGEEGGSMSMNTMLDIEASAFTKGEASIVAAKAEKGSKGSKTVGGGDAGGEFTGGGVGGEGGIESGSMSMREIEQHVFEVTVGSSQQVVAASKASKGTKATTKTETATSTTTVPGVETSGNGSMSMESTDRALEEVGYTTFGVSADSEVQNDGPVFYRRKYVDNHLL